MAAGFDELYLRRVPPNTRTTILQALRIPEDAAVEDVASIPLDSAKEAFQRLRMDTGEPPNPYELGQLMKPLSRLAEDLAAHSRSAVVSPQAPRVAHEVTVHHA